MANSAKQDQLASSEANWSGSTLFFKGMTYPCSAGLGLLYRDDKEVYNERDSNPGSHAPKLGALTSWVTQALDNKG